ncbi:MAG: hypothetical protein AB4206_06170 [Xenococcaceae cyanobacterium]
MLSKHTFLPTKSLFIAAGIAACGLAAVQQSASALTLTLENAGTAGPTYEYSFSTDMGGAIGPAQGFTILATGIDPGSVIVPQFDPGTGVLEDSFDFDVQPTSISFSNISGNIIGSNEVLVPFTFTSTDPLNSTVAWTTDAAFGTPTSTTITAPLAGPILPPPSAAIPFEFSPGLGLILSGTLFGALKLRSKFGKKEEISF